MNNQGVGPTNPTSAPPVHDTDRSPNAEHPTTAGETIGNEKKTATAAGTVRDAIAEEEQERARRRKIAQKAKNRRKRTTTQKKDVNTSPPSPMAEEDGEEGGCGAAGMDADKGGEKEKGKDKEKEKGKDKGKNRKKREPHEPRAAAGAKRYTWTSYGGGGARKESKKQQKIRRKMEEKKRRKAEKQAQAKQKETRKEKSKYYRAGPSPPPPRKTFSSKMYTATYETFKEKMEPFADSKPTLRRWYYKQCLSHHPDKGGDAEAFKALTEAYTEMLLFL